MGNIVWVFMMGVMSFCFFGIASINTHKVINMQPVAMSLNEDRNKEYLENSVKTMNHSTSAAVIFTFEDGTQLVSNDSRVNKYEAQQLLAGKSVDVFYHDGYPHAVFDEYEKPSVIPWWIGAFISLAVFILAIRLLKKEYAS